MDSKTMSTDNSNRNWGPTAIHSYHRYETILNYMVTYISHLKLNILELKEIVYHLVGVDLLPNTQAPLQCNCDDCEV